MQSTTEHYHDLFDTLLDHDLIVTLRGEQLTVTVNVSYAFRNAWHDPATSTSDYDLAIHGVTVTRAYQWGKHEAHDVTVTDDILSLAKEGIEEWLHKRAWSLLSRE